MKSKPFKDVQIGEITVMSFEPHDIEGPIMWKGTLDELKENEPYRSFIGCLESDYPDELDELDDYDWVIVNSKIGGPTLFNYNCDPSGVMVPIEEQITIGPYIYNEEFEKLASKVIGSGKGPELYFISVTNAVYRDGEIINTDNVKNIVIAITSILSTAISIFEQIIVTNEVKGINLEGIHGLIREKRTIEFVEEFVEEYKY